MPGWLSWLSVCLWLGSWSQDLCQAPCSAGSLLLLPILPLLISLSLSCYKNGTTKCNMYFLFGSWLKPTNCKKNFGDDRETLNMDCVLDDIMILQLYKNMSLFFRDAYWVFRNRMSWCLWMTLKLLHTKIDEAGGPGGLSELSICLQLRSWSQGPQIESHIGFPVQWESAPPSPSAFHSPCLCSVTLSLINK